MIKCKTLCVNCKYHTGSGQWYNHLCKHPETVRIEEQDPITGKMGYAGCNDLGGIYLCDSKYQNCRNLNKGNCPNFQKG